MRKLTKKTAVKKAVKKPARKAVATTTVKKPVVTMTLKQAQTLQAKLGTKAPAFLVKKIGVVNA